MDITICYGEINIFMKYNFFNIYRNLEIRLLPVNGDCR